MSDIPASKAKIAERLTALATEIEGIATAMDYYGGFAPWAQHAREMIGAARLCREWAQEIAAEAVRPAKVCAKCNGNGEVPFPFGEGMVNCIDCDAALKESV